ncbi:MAG: hypothetical protein Q9201_004184 [Fulgogasparrea decipioides]
MGPPSKPVDRDRPTDLNELSDVLMGAGVDLREEEAALLGRQGQDGAFNPFGASGLATAINPAHTSFNTYSQNVPGGADTFYGSGAFNQAAVPYQNAEEMAETVRKRATRRKAEMDQYHLNDPFLLTRKVQNKMSMRARNERVQVPTAGLYHPQAQQEVQQIVYGPDRHERLVTLKGQDLLSQDSPLVDLLTLISLAAEERLRTLIEDAAALAKGRRSGSNGVVPPQFLDIADINGMAETAIGLPTPGDSAVSPKANPLKRSYSDVNKPPTPISNGTQTPPTTFAPVLNPLTSNLRNSFLAERKAEEERLAKRARKATANSTETADGGASSAGGSGAATPAGPLGEKAPDIDLKRMPTKKELKKQADLRASDAVQTAATNSSLSMAIGGKRPSWLTGAKPAHTNPMLPRVNTGAAASSSQARANANAAGSGLPGARRFEFREDGEKGVGIQLRDLLFVMDAERKEKRALAKAWTKLTDKS